MIDLISLTRKGIDKNADQSWFFLLKGINKLLNFVVNMEK